MHCDIFNGDADGICALHQLRLAFPRQGTLVTGVKRDIRLLSKVDTAESATVLDISLDSNRHDLNRLLEQGSKIEYFDHHFHGEIPLATNLTAHIDTNPQLCTSLIVDRTLNAAYRVWAVVAAFGDNLQEAAIEAARPLNLPPKQLDLLKQLGEAINYNAYGETEADLFYPPAALYRMLSEYEDPFDFIEHEEVLRILKDGYAEDVNRLRYLKPDFDNGQCVLYVLPNEASSRRISGMFANLLAQDNRNRALAVLTPRQDANYLVSVRAPASKPYADTVCLEFPSGGGRKIAAGINCLTRADVTRFTTRFQEIFC